MQSDDDDVRDEFYSTLSAHVHEDENELHFRASDHFEQQDFELRKQKAVKPSKNPTHDTKYWGTKTSRKKLAEQNEGVLSLETSKLQDDDGYSDYDSEGSLEDDDDGSEGVEDDNNSDTEDVQPAKKRRVDTGEELGEDNDDDIDANDDDEILGSNDEVDESGDWEDIEQIGENEAKPVSKLGTSNPHRKEEEPQMSFFSESGSCPARMTDSARGLALKKQLSLWDKYFQLRVLLQKALHSANEISSSSIEKLEPGNASLADLIQKTNFLISKMVSITDLSLEGLPEENRGRGCFDGSESIEDKLEAIGRHLMSEAPKVMQFWNDKVQLSIGKRPDNNTSFSGNKNSMAEQIDGILADRARLLKRTRTKRVEYSFSDPLSHVDDSEIFDEYDFYQSLVKDLISNRASGQSVNPHSAEASMKLKSVKSITTQLIRKHKALVYDIHAKLVGFMAPVNAADDWRNEAIDSLALSVFKN